MLLERFLFWKLNIDFCILATLGRSAFCFWHEVFLEIFSRSINNTSLHGTVFQDHHPEIWTVEIILRTSHRNRIMAICPTETSHEAKTPEDHNHRNTKKSESDISGQIMATSHEFSPQKVAQEGKFPKISGKSRS